MFYPLNIYFLVTLDRNIKFYASIILHKGFFVAACKVEFQFPKCNPIFYLQLEVLEQSKRMLSKDKRFTIYPMKRLENGNHIFFSSDVAK